jgi:hypothetical protein
MVARLTPDQKAACSNHVGVTMAGNRTRVNCLEGSYAHHYTTIALVEREENLKIDCKNIAIKNSDSPNLDILPTLKVPMASLFGLKGHL